MDAQPMPPARHEELPQGPAADQFLDLHVLGIDPHLPGHGERNAVLPYGGDDAVRLRQGQRQRLLEDDRLAGRRGLLHQLGMKRGLGSHDHRFHAGPGEQVLHLAEGANVKRIRGLLQTPRIVVPSRHHGDAHLGLIAPLLAVGIHVPVSKADNSDAKRSHGTLLILPRIARRQSRPRGRMAAVR